MISTSLTALSGGQTIALLRSFIPASFVAPTVPIINRQTGAPDAFFATTVPGETIQAANNVALTAGSIRVS
ncbi:hypothetical protein NO135_23515, partial [Clostridioides difficile]|nr:hypothetical protein [Clostridioides difficile]